MAVGQGLASETPGVVFWLNFPFNPSKSRWQVAQHKNHVRARPWLRRPSHGARVIFGVTEPNIEMGKSSAGRLHVNRSHPRPVNWGSQGCGTHPWNAWLRVASAGLIPVLPGSRPCIQTIMVTPPTRRVCQPADRRCQCPCPRLRLPSLVRAGLASSTRFCHDS